MAADRYVRAAARLQQILGPDAPIIGGMAVNAYGYVRATQDVDLLVRMPLQRARERLEAEGIEVELRKGDPLAGEFSSLSGVLGVEVTPGHVEGVVFDVLPERVPVHPDRIVTLSVHGLAIRIVDLETLLRLKLKAGGPKDLYDIGVLANLNPEIKPKLLDHVAHKPRLLVRVQRVFDDPHVLATVRDLRRAEGLLSAFDSDLPRKRGR